MIIFEKVDEFWVCGLNPEKRLLNLDEAGKIV